MMMCTCWQWVREDPVTSTCLEKELKKRGVVETNSFVLSTAGKSILL
jgi:alanine-alpha-ketoisovalerate/valine-pyruvate aminotransferase